MNDLYSLSLNNRTQVYTSNMRLLLFTFLLFVSACTSNSEKQQTSENHDAQYAVHYATHFRFSTNKKNGEKVLEIIHPDTKKVMVQLTPLTANKNVIALSATFIGMMDKLQLTSFISGISEVKYIHNQAILDNFKHKKVIEVGYDTQLALEPIIASKPALILHSGYSSEFPHQKQLETVGIQCIPIYDWREESPLGKAEWIKVYGFLYGKEKEAEQLFSAIETSYTELKEQAKKLKPSALILSGNVIGSEWYCPAGKSFYAEFLKDANITYNYFEAEGTGSVALTQEKVLSENRYAAIWINPGAGSLAELKTINPKAPLFEAFKNGEVYCHSHNENFYWEVSSIEPDKLLEDLIQMTHSDYHSESGLYFYKKLE